MHSLIENWIPTKPAKVSSEGIVVAQHAAAAQAGAEILAAGGNAVDAAIATAFALGVVEPWMSGAGGAGYLVFGNAAAREVKIVDFGLIAAAKLDVNRYKLTGGRDTELFGWPLVEGNRNTTGYESICVPGSVDGLGLALETFGRKSLPEVLAPAIRLADAGLPVTWYTMLQIATSAADLREFPASAEAYLPNGLPPVPTDGKLRHLPRPALAAMYRRLAEAGRRDFYEGQLAAALVADLGAGGSAISAADLAAYRAQVVEPQTLDYRGVRLHAAPALTGGPTYLKAMAGIDSRRTGSLPESYPEAHHFMVYAEEIRRAFAERLSKMGQLSPASHTTHLSVVDRDGNMVALTNTLLSRFGSKVVLPKTGLIMNNGMMWFDPEPGKPNSLAAGKRPLCNMCPVVITRGGVPWVALGASGGRRIIPAIVQLTSFVVDFGMPLEKAFAVPRLDASTSEVLCDNRFPPEVIGALSTRLPVRIVEEAVYPGQFANPSAVMRPLTSNLNQGAAHIRSPSAAAVVAAGG